MHVVLGAISWHTQLHILTEIQSLKHGDIPIRLEQHHCHRPSGLQVPYDKFSDYVQPDIHIRRSFNYPQRHKPHHRDQQRYQKRPPAELRRIPLRYAKGDTQHD